MDQGRILLMRHAEKPDDAGNVNLSSAGQARAQKLVTYIPAIFGTPDFLYAAAISKESARPYQTLEPLSKKIDVAINPDYADKDYPALAHQLLGLNQFASKLVLVCWHHAEIPSFAGALGAKSGSYRASWSPAVFNLILQFEFVKGIPNVKQITEPF
jgi:hypothetical protein